MYYDSSIAYAKKHRYVEGDDKGLEDCHAEGIKKVNQKAKLKQIKNYLIKILIKIEQQI